MNKGCWVAAITPMTESGAIDYQAWTRILNRFTLSGVSGVVVLGTTAESINIEFSEREQLLKIASGVLGTTDWYVGVGHASMQTAITYSKQAIEYGASGLMAVSPFYNRPMADGLIQYYLKILAFGLPVMAYNVPSRTGIDVGCEVWDELYSCNNFVAIKEASPDVNRAALLVERYPRLTILSGNDNQLIPWLRLGGHGIVSVIANAIPEIFSEICNHALATNFDKAEELYQSVSDLLSSAELAVNPIAIKCIMHSLGLTDLGLRLPLMVTDEIYQEVTKNIKEELC